MNVATYQTSMTEKDLQQAMLDVARLHGWLCFHVYDSRRSHAGFPDLICIRGQRQIALELKGQHGRVGPLQKLWLEAFDQVPGCVATIVRAGEPKPGELSYDEALDLFRDVEP